MEGRMSICNMAIEAGARAGLVAPDETTFAYLEGRPMVPDADSAEWAGETHPTARIARAVCARLRRSMPSARLRCVAPCGSGQGVLAHAHVRPWRGL
eukprot:6683871-Prymnesium_polylepis.1